MFNGKYTSIDSILSNILRYPFVEGIQKEDIALYLSNFLRLVGAPVSFTNKIKNLKVVNYRVSVPSDLIFIKGIRFSEEELDNKDDYIPMKYASDIYHSGYHCSDSLRENDYCNNLSPTYTVDGTYIKTSEKEGFIQISYQSIFTDKDGLPMIPDSVEVTEAFKYYLLWQYAEPAFYRKDVPKDVYEDIKKEYMWYVGAATNSLNMLSPDQMKTLENGIIRLIKSNTQHETTWKRFQQKEVMNTKDKTKRFY